jgi:hypothetical protein
MEKTVTDYLRYEAKWIQGRELEKEGPVFAYVSLTKAANIFKCLAGYSYRRRDHKAPSGKTAKTLAANLFTPFWNEELAPAQRVFCLGHTIGYLKTLMQ